MLFVTGLAYYHLFLFLYVHKATVLEFFFISLLIFFSVFLVFPFVVDPFTLDFTFAGTFFTQTMKKVNIFNKWQLEGRPNYPLILHVKFTRLLVFTSGPIHWISLI